MKLLALYCLLVFLASLSGAALPTLCRLTHTRLQVAVSFVAGLMLGLATLGLLPHATHELGSPQLGAYWFLGGFLAMFFLQRFLPFHHHDVADDGEESGDDHAHGAAALPVHTWSWVGIAVGLSLHSIFDGVAMAAAAISSERGQSTALGGGTALAVILHKPFGAMAIATLMAASRAPRSARLWVNLAFAAVTPLGALLFFAGAGTFSTHHPEWLGQALAFCAGTFLCIAGADLLPELQFHQHDRMKLTLALLAGVGIALLIVRFGHHEEADPHPAAAVPVAPHQFVATWVRAESSHFSEFLPVTGS